MFQQNEELIMQKWDKEFGDRLNELVFIGQNMDETEIRKELEACLCSEDEIRSMQQGRYEFLDSWPI